MPPAIYLNGTATLDCSMNEKLMCFNALAACSDLQEKWNALLAEETIELKPVRRSKLRDSLSKLKAVISSSKQGKNSDYNILLQGDFMLRLKGKEKKGQSSDPKEFPLTWRIWRLEWVLTSKGSWCMNTL